MLIPGRPFWAGFTAFCANMVALFGGEKLTPFVIVVHNWWGAVVMSLLVGGAVYGKEKISDARETTKSDT